MIIRELRILPPFAIARVGSANEPVDSYVLEDDPENPLNFRRIRGSVTLEVNERTGEIARSQVPDVVEFKKQGRIRPVAPFLEVFAFTHEDQPLRPLDLDLLHSMGVDAAKVEWRVRVANRKVVRRTGNQRNLVSADTGWFTDHDVHLLQGTCPNFVSPDKWIAFGKARFIRPTAEFSQIRLRFTPGKGLIYGPSRGPGDKPDPVISDERAIYDRTKDWVGFGEDIKNDTLPPTLYAIEPPAPPWLHFNVAISRGYLDDTCDGFVDVRLKLPGGKILQASARICAGPPAVVPDSLFVRTLADDLEQVVHGPEVSREDEQFEVTRTRAAEIVRRAYETVRFMNVHLMNGNVFQGRDPLSLDTMPEEESADTERAIRPVMAPGTVDTLTILQLHEQVYTALRGGAAPWFVDLLRKPNEVADFTDRGRRKMPALMCGADNNYLALTWRQIDTIQKTCDESMFQNYGDFRAPEPKLLTPENLSAQLSYAATGNPINSRPMTAISNCCPGLEVDFRAVWRRMFKGIVLREYDNLVMAVDTEDGLDEKTEKKYKRLVGQRLLRVRFSENVAEKNGQFLMMTDFYGPAPSNPQGGKIQLSTQANPNGLAPVEWSNALAHILHSRQGQEVFCDFTKVPNGGEADMVKPTEHPNNYVTERMKVRRFFEPNTAVISPELAYPGELTQGLCSPWQNDYRECSCYYWASARPDFVNVEPTGNGLSKGDNWLQKERTGVYVPDDYQDSRLILYNELFLEWERWLRFQIGGRDVPDQQTAAAKGTA
jgi:hypothetical protein